MLKKITIAYFLITIALVPALTFGQTYPTGQSAVNIESESAVLNIIGRVFNFLFTILMFLTAIFLIYAAYIYLTAAGDEEKVKQAKNLIIYSVIAVVIAFVAWSLPALVKSILGS